MKKCILAIIVTFCVIQCIGQNNFEGVIKYNFNVLDLNSATISSTKVYFKKHKILVQNFPGTDSSVGSIETILDFDSGFAYHIEREEKMVLRDSLIKVSYKKTLPVLFNNKTNSILGYECSLINYKKINIADDSMENVNLWYAKKLEFPLPANYYPFLSSVLFVNGKNICLSGYFTAYIYRHAKARINNNAVSVSSIVLPDSIFELPKDFVVTQVQTAIVNKTELKVSEIKSDVQMPPPPPPPLLPSAKKKTGKKMPTKAVKTTSTKEKQ